MFVDFAAGAAAAATDPSNAAANRVTSTCFTVSSSVVRRADPSARDEGAPRLFSDAEASLKRLGLAVAYTSLPARAHRPAGDHIEACRPVTSRLTQQFDTEAVQTA